MTDQREVERKLRELTKRTRDGSAGEPLLSATWTAPIDARLVTAPATEDPLIAYIPGEIGKARNVKPEPELLVEFIRLNWEEDPQAFVAFAQRWGGLGFCAHRLPHTHNRLTWLSTQLHLAVEEGRAEIPSDMPLICTPLTMPTGERLEPIRWWRNYARLASEIVEWAHAVRHVWADQLDDDDQEAKQRKVLELVRVGRVADATRLIGASDGAMLPPIELANPAGIRIVIDGWLDDAGGISLGFDWSHDAEPRMQFGIRGLMGAIGFQLAAAVAGDSLPEICSNCFRPFSRLRSDMHRCQECGKKARDRDSQRAKRERRRAATRSPAG